MNTPQVSTSETSLAYPKGSIEKLEASSKLRGASPEGEVGTSETPQVKTRIASILFGINPDSVSKVVDENSEKFLPQACK